MPQTLFTASPVAQARVVVLVALLFVAAGPACAQQAPGTQPSSGDYLRQFNKQMEGAEAAGPQFGEYTRLFKSWVFLTVVAVVVVGVAVVVGVGVRVYLRMSTTTDPEKLALSDPWVRAELARRKAEADGNLPGPS
jgi:hypothetical protein